MSSSSSPWLVVGLGNPGDRYVNTRHNVGHMTVEELSRRMGEGFRKHASGTRICDARLGMLPGGIPGPRVVLAMSEGYMNVSGGPVGRLMKALSIPVDRLLVVHDDLDLPEHDLRLKKGGGEGGHNGLKSISQVLGTRDYARLRIGIGRPPARMDPADYVLAKLPKKEAEDWGVTIQLAADVVEDIVTTDFADAQQRLHSAR